MLMNAYEHNIKIQGTTVQEVLLSSGMTLQEYLADVRGKQWACVIELTLAAEYLGIGFDVVMNAKYVHVGHGDSDLYMHLASHHYMSS